MASIADVYVTVLGETAGLKEDIRKAVKSAESGLKVNVGADTTEAKAELKKLDGEKVKVKVDVDDSQLRRTFSGGGGGRGFGGGGGGIGSWFTNPIKLNVAMVGIGSLQAGATALADVAGAIQQVSGAGLALPGVFAGIASSAGVAKLSTMGMTDAFKALDKAADGTQESVDAANKALEKLAPNAAETVKQVYGMKGTLEDLSRIGGQNMFAGVAEGSRNLAQNLLPAVTRGIDGISKGLNQNLLGVINSLGSGSSQGLLDRIFGNTSAALGGLTPAIEPLIHVVEVLSAAGSDTLPRLAIAVGNVADRFNNFISGADADGRLNKWINDGLTGLTSLGNIVLDLGKSFTSITEAAGGGEGLLSMLEGATGRMADFLASTEGQDQLKTFFAEGRDMLSQFKDIAVELGPILSGIFDAGVTSAGLWLPVIREVLDIINSIPGGAQAVVTAFVAWRTISGISSLATSLTNIANLLKVTLPAAAAEGAAGAGLALGGLSVTAGGVAASITAAFAALPTAKEVGDRLRDGANIPQSRVPRLNRDGTVDRSGTPGYGVDPNKPTSNLNMGHPLGVGIPGSARRQGWGWMPSAAPTPGAPGAPPPGSAGNALGAASAPVTVPPLSSYSAPVVTDPGSGGGSGGGVTDWNAIAQAESGGNWQTNTGNGYYGGLQFDLATWQQFGGTMFAERPDLATREQQISVANSVPKAQRAGRWPNTYKESAAGTVPTSDASSGYTSGPVMSSSTYGLPGGTNTGGYGTGTSATFPPWVMALAQQFNVSPSTYAGHQESDRNEPGYAPNPQHLNRGIDWSGSPENMQRFAEYVSTLPQAEQVIFNGPGGPVEAVAGQRRPGYFAGDLAGHGNHVHTRQSMALPLPGTSSAPLDNAYPMSTYDAQSGDPAFDKKIRDAQEKVDDKSFAVSQAEQRLNEMNAEGTATAKQRADAEHDLVVAKREHVDAQTDLNAALQEGGKLDKKKDGKGGPGENLGQDIVKGMLDVFGFGDVFKDPTQFGLFKILKGAMGLKFADDGQTQGGDGASLFGSGGGGGGGLLDTLTGFIPQAFGNLKTGSPGDAPGSFMPAMPGGGGGGGIVAPGNVIADPNSPPGVAGPGNQPGMVNDFRGANFGYSATGVKDQVNSAHLQQVRQPLRSLPS